MCTLAGEVWTLDNWRYHEVRNNSEITRVHLVIDTVGSPELWNMLEQQSCHPKPGETLTPPDFIFENVLYEQGKEAHFPIEKHNIIGLLSPAELDAIADFLACDVDIDSTSPANINTTLNCLHCLKRQWRTLWPQYVRDENYYRLFSSALQLTCSQINQLNPKPTLKSNSFYLGSALNTQASLTMVDVLNKQQQENVGSSDLQVSPQTLQHALRRSFPVTPNVFSTDQRTPLKNAPTIKLRRLHSFLLLQRLVPVENSRKKFFHNTAH